MSYTCVTQGAVLGCTSLFKSGFKQFIQRSLHCVPERVFTYSSSVKYTHGKGRLKHGLKHPPHLPHCSIWGQALRQQPSASGPRPFPIYQLCPASVAATPAPQQNKLFTRNALTHHNQNKLDPNDFTWNQRNMRLFRCRSCPCCRNKLPIIVQRVPCIATHSLSRRS